MTDYNNLLNFLKEKKNRSFFEDMNYNFDDINIYTVLMKYNLYIENYVNALFFCRLLIKNNIYFYDYVIPTTMRICCRKLNLYNTVLTEKIWRYCSPEAWHLADRILNFTLDAEENEAKELFATCIGYMNLPPQASANLHNAFQLLLDCIIYNKIYIVDKTENIINNKKIIFVEGTGFSGASAIVDYLKDFADIATAPIEFMHLHGLHDVFTSMNDDSKSYKRNILIYFFKCLVGLYIPKKEWDYKFLYGAHYFLSHDKYSVKYTQEIIHIIKLLTYSIIMFDNNMVNKRKLKKLIIHSVIKCIAVFVESKIKYIVLDNTLQMNENLIELVDDMKIFFVMRDPRSNYGSINKHLNTKCHITTVEKFIRFYKNRMEVVNNLIKKFPYIYKINFEAFVICDIIRSNFLQYLSITETNKYKKNFFNPIVSLKNIFNYKDIDMDDIKKISNDLNDYIIDYDE